MASTQRVRWFLAIASVVPSLAHAGPPRQPTTLHENRAQCLELYRRQLPQAFRKVGQHGPWDAAAERYLDEMALYFTYFEASKLYRDVPVPTLEHLSAAGKALVIDARCTDPLVLYCHGKVLDDSGKVEEGLTYLQRAAFEMDRSGYADIWVFWAANRFQEKMVNSDAGRKAAAIRDARALKLANVRPVGIERREAIRAIGYYSFYKLDVTGRETYFAALRRDPKADPWVLDFAEGDSLVRSAVDLRYAPSGAAVDGDNLKRSRQCIALAREHLTSAWKRAPELPDAPARMISVAMRSGGGDDELQEGVLTWFERAIDAELDHPQAYTFVLDALLPRWGGSHAELYEIGRMGANTQRYDTDAPWQLWNAVRQIVWDANDDWAVLSKPGVYEQLCDMVDAYDAVHFKRGNRWYRSFRAALAWRAGKYAESRKVLDKLGPDLDKAAFDAVLERRPAFAIGQVYAMTGSQADMVKRGEAAVNAEQWDAALDAFVSAQDALKHDASYPKVEPYLSRQRIVIERRIEVAKGQPTDCQPDNEFTGWTSVVGAWEVAQDGRTVVGRYLRDYTPCLRLDEPLGDHFEFRGHAAHGKFDGRPAINLIGQNDDDLWIILYERAVMLSSRTLDKSLSFKRERSTEADFNVLFERGTLTVEVNGKTVIDHHLLPEQFEQNCRPALAFVDSVKGSAQFSNLSVRKLPHIGGREH